MTRPLEAVQGGRRVWSLLEVLKFNAAAFHIVTQSMESLASIVEHESGSPYEKVLEGELGDKLRHNMRGRIEELQACLSVLDAKLASAEAQRLMRELSHPGVTYEDAAKRMREIGSRLNDELEGRQFFVLPNGKAAYYEPASPLFGDEVSTGFPAASYDIDEAGKCFALERYTATAFHLMRVVEIGIRELCDALNVTVSPNAGWQKILNDKLEPAINALPESAPAEKARKTDLQQARAHLHAIRLGWRNDTMHPKATYTEEEAKWLIGHVETFMRHLATRLDVQGSPS